MLSPASVWAFLLRFQSFFGLFAVFVLAVIYSPINRAGQNVFLLPDNQLNILRFASENGIIAIGMTLVILTGGIDLSVVAVLALCAVAAAKEAFKKGVLQAKPVLLEPILTLRVIVPDQYTGDVMSDLNSKRAQVSDLFPAAIWNISLTKVPKSACSNRRNRSFSPT